MLARFRTCTPCNSSCWCAPPPLQQVAGLWRGQRLAGSPTMSFLYCGRYKTSGRWNQFLPPTLGEVPRLLEGPLLQLQLQLQLQGPPGGVVRRRLAVHPELASRLGDFRKCHILFYPRCFQTCKRCNSTCCRHPRPPQRLAPACLGRAA